MQRQFTVRPKIVSSGRLAARGILIGTAVLCLAGTCLLRSGVEETAIFGRVVTLPTGDAGFRAEVLLSAIEDRGSSSIQVSAPRKTVTDDNGNYRFTGVHSGHYVIQAWMPGFATTKVWDVYVWKGAERVVVDLGLNVGGHAPAAPNEISGEVKSTIGGALGDVTMTAIQFETRRQVQTRTDQRGRYSLPVINGGSWAVQAHKPGFRPEFRAAEVYGKAAIDFTLKQK